MQQTNLFEADNNESEEDLGQNQITFSEAVIWGTDWTTETITNQLLKKNIDLKPKFQRRDAWTPQAKSKFIESLILGLPIPQIILAERRDQKGKYIVIDGKQRLLTIRRFFAKENDEFDSFKLSGLTILKTLNGKKCSELLEDPSYSELIDQLQNQTIRTTVIRNWPDEAFLFTVFLRLNTGSIKLSPQELRQALHPGDFIDFTDSFSIESESIKKMLKLNSPDFRMRDVEMVIRYFNLMFFLNEYDGNLKNAFDKTVNKLNKEWQTLELEIRESALQLEKAIDFTMLVFGERDAFSKWNGTHFQGKFNRAVFDIMVYYFSQQSIRQAAEEKKEEVKAGFINCFNDSKFANSIELTTKSLVNTEARLNIWGKALATILKEKIRVPQIDDSNRIIIINSNNG